jgi:APA family basic amino acid/polyamine antiporter
MTGLDPKSAAGSVLPAASQESSPGPGLKRVVGLWGAVMMGLGSILGTGVFVSIAIATDAAGPAVVVAIAVAAMVAIFNGLSSAQLAAAHPVSGGTYEYGYRLLNPWLGFTAGWTFLWAKSASAATAALAVAGAIGHLLGWESFLMRVILAEALVVGLTLLILGGIRRSNRVNMLMVGFTVVALSGLIVGGLIKAWPHPTQNFWPLLAPVRAALSPWAGFWQASALMFVAFTGYGRIATLAEEVQQPRQTIPRAVIVTLLLSMVLYIAVGYVAIASLGAAAFAAAIRTGTAPLQQVAVAVGGRELEILIAAGALTALLGVSLNLVLGLSRVALAMARRQDLPLYFAEIDGERGSPDRATWLVAVLIMVLVAIGNVTVTWSLSAFAVLIYYAITNLAALRLPADQRMFPPLLACLGLVSCLGLAFWVQAEVWLLGLIVIALGLAWHATRPRKPHADLA